MSAISTTYVLGTNISLLTNTSRPPSLSYPNIQLSGFATSNIGRVVYIKEASDVSGGLYGPSVMSIQAPTGGTVLNSTMIYLSSKQCVTLQCFSSQSLGFLGAYTGLSQFSTQILPSNTTVLTPSLSTSQLFVDLRTESKTVVLPSIASLTTESNIVPFYTFKDIYGKAANSTFYISTTEGDMLETSSIQNSIALQTNYASIDLAANLRMRTWLILNYYNGVV
jgi:hypothetical protein